MIAIITQARVGSTRLPGKVLKEVNGESMLEIHLRRLMASKVSSKIVVATTLEEEAEGIVEIAESVGVDFFQGSTEDVLDRFYKAAKPLNPKIVVRVTSDCPLIDGTLIDNVVEKLINEDLDYCANILEEHFPDGQDVEAFTMEALENAWLNAKLHSEREHVTPYIRDNSDFNGGSIFRAGNVESELNYNHVRITVDEQEDFEALETLINHMGLEADWKSYTKFILDNPDLFSNQKKIRNEGYLKSLEKDKGK